MKHKILTLATIAFLFSTGCKKEEVEPITNNSQLEQNILNDFANVLVYPNYSQIYAGSNAMNTLIQSFVSNPDDATLELIRQSWKTTRSQWELSESYLFGPVDDFSYDPMMDTWPINHVDLDSLLATSVALTPAYIETLPTSLKGFHPIEYLIFGLSGSRYAVDFTARELEYLSSLSTDLNKITLNLKNSWDPAISGNFSVQLTTAGTGSNRFASRKDAFITIVNAMAGICDEVANGKMEDPLVAQDSLLEESQFSHNSLEDFTNNIRGVRNAYLCTFTTDGTGLNELVASINISLDNSIRSKIDAAINSFSAIDPNYGRAIYYQQIQIMNTQSLINDLKNTLETDLIDFVQTNVKD
jgi:putative iron-regulated protein